MLINHPAFEGVTVHIISRDTVFARMLELELTEVGIGVSRFGELSQASFPKSADKVITIVSSELLSEDQSACANIEFGYSECGSGRSERYFKRPFIVEELIDAVLSFVQPSDAENVSVALKSSAPESIPQPLNVGLTRDGDGGDFLYNGEAIALTETERLLLEFLYENRGSAVSREEILTRVWGRDDNENARKTNLTDVYIRYLREKLDDRFGVRIIFSVRGKGYMLK